MCRRWIAYDRSGGLLLDPISHRVTIDGKLAEVGPTEYDLLQFFMTHQERAYTKG